MSISTEVARLQAGRNKIRAKLVALGLAQSTDKLDILATAIDGIADNGAVSANVKEGETYTIPKGYHNGSGTVSGVAGGGSYNLQSKTIKPTKKQINVTPDSGYYGLSDVTVEAIPENYQDVSSVTVTEGDVLTGKIFVGTDGVPTAGSMPNNGAVAKKLTADAPSYTVPKGYHSGLGSVSIDPEPKTATPTKSQQTISPTEGKVLSTVTIEPIPDNYADTSDANAEADQILAGSTAYVGGVKVEGTMPKNEAISKTLDASTPSYTIPAGYHDGTGVVNITPETKSVTPTKAPQSVTPTAGKVLTKVDVGAIPEAYQDVTEVTAGAADVLTGKVIVSATGEKVSGSMANNGAINKEIDGLSTFSAEIPAGYTSGGTVTLTGDIEAALAAI